jgi:hypothetical protein
VAPGHEIRSTPTPPAPGAVATAAIVSACAFIASGGRGLLAAFDAARDDPLLQQ